MLFDTHAHMDDRAFDADRETLLSALPGRPPLWRPDMTTSMPPSAPTRTPPTR